MQFQPVILWTDALIYLLAALSLIGIWHTRRREHLAAPWRRVMESRTAQVSVVVLAFYVLIGLLDTLHFHPPTGTNDRGETVYSTEVLSLFDIVATDLRTQREKTYSAPFAVFQFSKEALRGEDGRTTREYPRLRYGGAHLDAERDR